MIALERMAPPAQNAARIYGVVIGMVTDRGTDGRVKVKFPWLSEKDEGNWARMVTPMAGNDRGFQAIPEVDDEVLVAFEHGDVRFPYVLGSLWNGKDKPPVAENDVRIFKSRSGLSIALDDTKGGEQISIVDAEGKNSIILDVAKKTITITADQDVAIESTNGKVKLTAKQGIEIDCPDGQVDIKGKAINLN